ncbi:MAG TPA: S41 family peptidase [Candidatus Limnocylindrales bacterium]|jgi:carboxyl-terminal processing protease
MSAPVIPAGGDESAPNQPSSGDVEAALARPGEADGARQRGRRAATGSSRFATVLVAVLAASAIFVGGYTLGAHVATTPGTPAGEESRFAPFWDVYSLIQNEFAGSAKPSPDALVRAAINGMMQSLNDPYSYYQEPAAFQNSLLGVGGQAVGVGVQVRLQPVDPTSATDCTKIGGGCELAVVQPIAGSPAEKAGIQPGDVFVAVNSASLDGLTVDQASTLIRGDKGTKVTLLLDRAGQRVSITVTRDVFDVPELVTKAYENGAVEYIDVLQIDSPASKQLDDALKTSLAAGARAFILDLRGNPGGSVTDAVTMASEFISSGTIAYQVDASGTETEATRSQARSCQADGQWCRATDPSIRVMVLVDPNTASSAEILAGALQARGRASLVGDHTFGKGIFQEWLPLPNDAGGIHLTVGRWLTPNHVWIQGKGLQPDVPVSSANARAGQDPVLDAALVKLGYPAQSEPSPSPSSAPNGSPSPSSSPSPSATPSPSAVPSPS